MGIIIREPKADQKAPETTAPDTAAVQTKSCACAAEELHIKDSFQSILHDNVQTARFERNTWFLFMIIAVLILIFWLRKAIG